MSIGVGYFSSWTEIILQILKKVENKFNNIEFNWILSLTAWSINKAFKYNLIDIPQKKNV